jgi:phospholipase/carboxylesterase
MTSIKPLSSAIETVIDAEGLFRHGAPPSRARAFMLMVHGRGANAGSILSLADALAQPDVCFLAPQAARGSWYPYSFLAPMAQNEPYLSQALATLHRIVEGLVATGVVPANLALLGFSQGACLTLEFAARHARPYGAVIGLSGGLIGPPGTPRTYPGSLAGTEVFLGCSDVDSHIPLTRVHESTEVFRAMGADVTERIYPGFGHGVNDDEIAHVRRLLDRMQVIAGDARVS